MEFAGRVALVTGGAVRIGAAIVRTLAARGAGVVIHHDRSGDAAAALATELRAAGGRAWTIAARLDGDEAGCAALIRGAVAAAGRLDILVNNAALFSKQDLAASTGDALRAMFDVNTFAPWQLIRAFAAACDAGRIINLLDRRIASNDPACLPYLISKKALRDLTAAAALALAPRFTVNGVAPGPVLPPPGEPSSYLREKGGRVPMAGPCTPEQVAEAVAFLAGADAITGNTLFVDGGQHLLGEGVDAGDRRPET